MLVFVVQHVHEIDSNNENIKMIGVYSTEKRAQEAVERLTLQPGFSRCQEGFEVIPYPLDKDHWVEGFITIEGDKPSV